MNPVKTHLFRSAALLTLLLPFTAHAVPDDAEKTQPLQAGKPAPNPDLHLPDGSDTTLDALRDGKPTVLIFYRGGWCPYCRRHLAALMDIEQTLVENGWKLLALSPDRPEVLQQGIPDEEVAYQLVSDQDMRAAKAFGIAFRVADSTVKKYEGYGIDLEKSSGRDHQLLPVPAVFLVDADGNIVFTYTNPDYKKRLSNAEILKAAGLSAPDAEND